MNKRKKRVLLALAGIVVLMLLTAVLLSIWIKPRIRQALDDLVRRGSDSLYQYQFKSISIDWFGGDISIEEFRLFIDSARYTRLEKQKQLPAVTVEGELPTALISGVRLLPFLFKRSIQVKEISLDKASWAISRHFYQAPRDSVDITTLYQRIQPDISEIRIDRINIADLKIIYKNADSAKAFEWTFNKANAYFEDIAVNEKTASDRDRVMYADNFFVGLENARLRTGDSLYAIGASKVTYSTRQRVALIDSLTLQPTMEKGAFYARLKQQKERYTIGVQRLLLENLSLGELLTQNRLKADSLILNGLDINVYNDRSQPPSRESKMGKFPNQLLQKINMKMHIGVLVAGNARIAYVEKQASSGTIARVLFSEVNGTARNVSNDSTQYLSNDTCRIDVRCMFLGQTPLQARFWLALKGDNGDFQVDAHFGKANAEEISALTSKLENITVKDFKLEGLHCHISGNQYKATASVEMKYTGLKVELHRDAENGKTGKKKGLLSGLVNALAVYNDNPQNGQPPRVARRISYQRNPKKSFFNLIWKSMLTGIGDIVVKPIARGFLKNGG